MIRLLLFVFIVAAGAAEPESHGPAVASESGHEVPSLSATAALQNADRLIERYNPNLLASQHERGIKNPVHNMSGAFVGDIATDVTERVRSLTWFSSIVFLPFLIIPQILLLYVIFKYRDRRDGRKAATFTGNHKLELIWTAIPCFALLIVSIPVWDLAWWMELAPRERLQGGMQVEIIGSKFKWDYKYLKLGGAHEPENYKPFEIGSGRPLQPEPMVLVKDRVVTLDMTSTDVNHSWWIPAFGIKQDNIIGRHTHAWFTPKITGFFKGQCAELCGEGHGIMLIAAVVVDEHDFTAEWLPIQTFRTDAAAVISALRTYDQAKIATAVDAYVTAGSDRDRVARAMALNFWVANHFALLSRSGDMTKPAEVTALAEHWRPYIANRIVSIPPTAEISAISAAPPTASREGHQP